MKITKSLTKKQMNRTLKNRHFFSDDSMNTEDTNNN